MKTITIGEGTRPASSVRYVDINDNVKIYHNNVLFSIRNCWIGFNLIIFKDTEDGQVLDNWLKSDDIDIQQVYEWLIRRIIANISTAELIETVENSRGYSYSEGKSDGYRNRSIEVSGMISNLLNVK